MVTKEHNNSLLRTPTPYILPRQAVITPEIFVGCMTALFVLIGRWNLSRLLEDLRLPGFFEPRLGIVLVLFVVALVLKKKPQISAAKRSAVMATRLIAFPAIAYLAYMMLTFFWSPTDEVVRLKLYDLALILMVTVALYRCFTELDNHAILVAFWKSTLLFAGIVVLVALFDLASASPSARAAALGGGPNAFGRLAGLFCFGNLFMWRRSGKLWLYLPGALIGCGLVILSGSRGALVASAIAAVSFLLVERIPLTKVATFGVAAVILSLFVLWYTPLGHEISATFERRILILSIERQYVSSRDVIFEGAFEIGMEYPINGAGLAAVSRLDVAVYAHNIFLETFSEGGGIGLFFLLMTLSTVFFRLWRGRFRFNGATVAAFVLCLIFSQFSGDLFDSRTVFAFMFLATIANSLPQSVRQGRTVFRSWITHLK